MTIRRRPPRPAVLALADGSVFRGHAFGAEKIGIGEVCFNTSMTGYQEILTDPSYAGQLVAMTYTQIGIVGVNPEDVSVVAEKSPATPVPAPAPGRKAGDIVRDRLSDGTRGPEMVVVDAGRFQMGSPSGAKGRDGDEGPVHAVRIARQVEQYQPYWFEEPVLAENIDALAAARREISIPVVTGEELYTKFEFREVFERSAADIINPDVCNVGGILELKEIAAMAEVYFVAVSPHNYNSTTVGLAATLQAAATMPNFIITEYFVNLEPWGQQVADPPFEVVDSHITLSDRPGLGIDLDEAALAASPYQVFPQRSLGD